MEKTKKSKSTLGKIIRISLISLVTLLLLVIIAAIAIPYFFKDEIIDLTKKEINKQVNAEVDFGDIEVSLFSNFPELTVGLNDFKVTGVDQFEGIPLASLEKLNLSLDIMSVIQKDDGQPYAVNTIGLVKPDINILVLRDGSANYDIAPTSEDDTSAGEATAFQLELSEYYIKDGKLVYDDRQGGTYLKIEGLNHNGSGNFTESIYDIFTTTSMDGLTFSSGGMNYLKDAQIDADITLNADMNTSTYRLKENSIGINALQLDTEGWVQTEGDNINMDMNFNAPSTAFKDFLSLIPGAYTKEFEDVKADGTFAFNGNAKGTFNETKLPAFNLNLDVNDAAIQYPDLPMGMKEINTHVKINSTTSDLDDIAVDVTQFHMLLGENPFDAQLKLRTPLSDPDVDAVIDGTIDLEEVSQAFPVEGVESMKGKIIADVDVKTKMSYIDNEEYDKVDMNGKMQLENMDYASEGMPHVLVNLAQMDFTPQNVKLNEFDAKIGKSDIKASGTLDNILAYFSPGTTMKGALKVRSDFFDANEWLTEEETTPSPTPTATATVSESSDDVFDQFEFNLDAEMGKIRYEDYELVNTVAKGSFTPENINLDQLSTKIGQSDIKMDGELTNIFGYLFDNEIIGGEINLTSNYLNLNELMGIEEVASTNTTAKTTETEAEAYELVLVPDYLAMKVNADIKEVIYTNLDLKELKGVVDVKNEKVSLTDVAANLLGGRMQLTGGYDTSNKEKPMFEFGYDISKFDFQKSFQTFNTFQAAAPIGDYIKGIFNSKLSLSGVMGKDMMPDLNTLSAQGELLTLDAIIQNFIPMKEISNTLNIKYLQDEIKLTNTLNKFKILDGRVQIEEFPFKYKDVNMRVGGSHGFDQSIDYVMSLDVPMELIGKGKVAGYAESGLDFLNGVAGKAGLNLNGLNIGDMVQIDLKLTGDIKKPKVKVLKVKMSDSEGNSVKDNLIEGVKDIVDDKIQEGKDLVNDKVEEVVDKVDDKVDEAVNQVEEAVNDKVDEAIDKVEDQVNDKVEEVVGDKVDEVKDQVGDKVDDALDGKAEDIKDAVKDQLGGWKPWKKKKKKDDE